MSRRASLMSDELKYELAKELGVTDIVDREGWGGVSARNCGNLVKLAIQRAELSLAQGGQAEGAQGPQGPNQQLR